MSITDNAREAFEKAFSENEHGGGLKDFCWRLWQRHPAAVTEKQGEPAGWKLVPVELTDEMQMAGALAHQRSVCHDFIGPIDDAWTAMLAASPTNSGASSQLQGAEDALRAIMRQADRFKEPCGMDPESPAAIRNGMFATLAQMAAQGLGLVRGPSLATPPTPSEAGGPLRDNLVCKRSGQRCSTYVECTASGCVSATPQEPDWRPFGLTVEHALNRGDDPALLFDENSPVRGELRRLLASPAPGSLPVPEAPRAPMTEDQAKSLWYSYVNDPTPSWPFRHEDILRFVAAIEAHHGITPAPAAPTEGPK